MRYPKELIPNSIEVFVIEGKELEIPKCTVEFNKWTGKSIKNTFGNKPLLDFDGHPMFAELLILNLFIKNGWNSRWVETYGKPKLNPIYLNEWKDDEYKNQVNVPINNPLIQRLLNEIAHENGRNFGGCWDVLAWKGSDVIFAESKRSRKDFLQSTQNKWINSAFKKGLKSKNFIIVEWKTR